MDKFNVVLLKDMVLLHTIYVCKRLHGLVVASIAYLPLNKHTKVNSRTKSVPSKVIKSLQADLPTAYIKRPLIDNT